MTAPAAVLKKHVAAIPAAIVGGSYGFWRAQNSNRRLGAPSMPPVAIGSEG